MKVTEIAFSCYAVTNVPRSRSFYEGVLGLEPAMVAKTPGGEWIEYAIGAHTLSIGCAPGFQPSADGCIVALEVDDFDGAVAKLRAAGVPFRFEPMETPVCHMAMVADPDNNTVCIHRRKTSA